jgi:sulfur-oxidizing protein SoxZ
MASTIRVKAVAGGGKTVVQSLIRHPMDSGRVKDKKTGKVIPAHHIEVLQFEHDGKTVFTAYWGPAVSKDPYVKFSFNGGKKGDDLKVSWVDNEGKSDQLSAKIQ